MTASDAAAERAALADEVVLANEFVQVARSHPRRERLALGRRLEERFWTGPGEPPGGWHGRMVPGGNRLERHSGDLHDDPQRGEDADEGAADLCDPADVAANVGVFVAGRDGKARHRPWCKAATGALRTGLARGLGRLLFGDDRGLELGGSGLLVLGERRRARLDPWRRHARSGRRSLRRPALAGPGGRASGALGHDLLRASIAGSDRFGAAWRPGPVSRRQRIAPATGRGGEGRAARTSGYVPGEGALLDSARPLEDPPIDLNALVQPYLGALVVGLVAVGLVLVIAAVALARRTRRLDGRLRGMTRGTEGRSLEAVLDAHLEKVFAVSRELDGIAARTAILEGAQRRAFQRAGLVRYNPFDETGGNQSFALALLDANGDGWVLSSLHARSGTRVYAKAIKAGRAESGLSAEETAALQQASA